MGASEEYIEIPEVPTNPDFDPTRQFFWILLQDGKTLVETSVFDIDELRMVSVYQAASFAAQVGAASVLLAAIFLMTKSEKRRSSVFCLNALSLALVIIRGILSLESLTGPFYEFWSWKTHTYINVGDAEIISALSGVAGLLLTIAILLASFVQVRIVCCTLSDTRRYLINISNAIVISAAVAMRFALTVISIKWNTLDASNMDITRFNTMNKLGSAANITLVITIAFSTVIFTAKLASAIIARRSMGMKQFGPMQIIFVMGCQTMFTPLIFTIITYTSIKNANVQSFVPAIVAVSLPLSGMWAAVKTENFHIANANPRKHRVVPLGASDQTYGGSSSKGPSTTSMNYDDDKCGLTTPRKADRYNSEADLEMQRMGDGVNVERSYSVRSD